MALRRADDPDSDSLRDLTTRRLAPTRSSPEPPSLLHHPVVGVSLVLIAASAAQALVWLINTRLLSDGASANVPLAPSSLVASDLLYTSLENVIKAMDQSAMPPDRLMFGLGLTMSMAAAGFWYAVIRLYLGPAWALAAGLIWALHPLPAFLAQRPGPLTTAIFLVPAFLTSLLWWTKVTRRRTALLAGLTGGLLGLINVATLVLMPLLAAFAFLAAQRPRRAWQGVALMLASAAIPMAVVLISSEHQGRPLPTVQMNVDLWSALHNSHGPSIAIAARAHTEAAGAQGQGQALAWLGRQWLDRPYPTTLALLQGVWRTTYATAGGSFENILLALQVGAMVPAAWGAIVALAWPGYRRKTALLLSFAIGWWLSAALAQPLARQFIPVETVFITLAVVGLADLYERLFGRRLIAQPTA